MIDKLVNMCTYYDENDWYHHSWKKILNLPVKGLPLCIHWMKMLLWHKPITLIGTMWCNLYNVPHIHRPFDTRFTNLRRQHANQDNLLEIYCFAGYCLSFIDLRLLSTPMRSVVRYHTSIISLFMTYHRMLYNSNMMGATNG